MTDQHTIREEQAEDARERAEFERITGEDIARHERELEGERAAREAVAGDDVDDDACATESDRRGPRPFTPAELRAALEAAAELINRVEIRERATGRACGLPIALELATLRVLTQAAHRDFCRFVPSGLVVS